MWYQLVIEELNRAQATALEPHLMALDALSVTFQDAKDEPILEPKPGEAPLWSQSSLIALYKKETLCQQAYDLLSEAEFKVKQEVLEDEAWEKAWQVGYEPMLFGKNLCICPSHRSPPDESKITVFMDPGLAFGSGTHATTALCLDYLDEESVIGKRVIDYGCGSGILAISALKLGAKEAFCSDLDEQALLSTMQNAKRNEVEAGIKECSLPEEFAPAPADILLANILAGPNIELREVFYKLIHDDGVVVLSGILESQSQAVINAYQEKFKLVDNTEKDGWVRLVFRKKD